MKLSEIGFYTLSDERAKQASETSPFWRCELVLTGRCNFRCPYCRSVGGQDIPLEQAKGIVRLWAEQGLKNIRFSGGEPTLYTGLVDLVALAKSLGVERVAVSSNGASAIKVYERLLGAGVTDFSISLDACCAEDGDRMAGGRKGSFDKVVATIRYLSARTYVTVGVVLTPDNKASAEEIVRFADSLGVHDIRVIPAAQAGQKLPALNLAQRLLAKYPILRYRVKNLAEGKSVRGLDATSPKRCALVLDDMAVMGDKHYPCIIYMREGGKPIGTLGPNMRVERAAWAQSDRHQDPICAGNCLDVCRDYNEHASYRGQT
jgi:molybdenum cofactor biosynthesis enzyme MoaA